jgi:hypothetical protein
VGWKNESVEPFVIARGDLLRAITGDLGKRVEGSVIGATL